MTAPNNPYPALGRAIDPSILHSIQRASQATSTDFGLLMAQAAQESGFQADAKSASSSASGLYQFIETRHPNVFRDIAEKKQLDDALKAALDGAVKEFAAEFKARKATAA